MPHCNVTIVPYHLGTVTPTPDEAGQRAGTNSPTGRSARSKPEATVCITDLPILNLPADRTRIAEIQPRLPTSFAGRVRAMRIQPWGGNPALECVVADETGSIVVVFFGRRELGGVRLGTLLKVEGVVGEHRGTRSILNPRYTILATPPAATSPNHHES